MAAEPDSRDDHRQSDLAVMSANEFKQKHRLERILTAMDNIEGQANKAWDRFVEGEISHDGKNIMIQRAVKEAIREAYNLLIEHHQSKIRQAKENSDEEAEGSEYWIGRGGGPIGVIEQVSEDNKVLFGLRDFLATEEFYTEEWTETDGSRHGAPQQIHQSRKQSVPEHVSWNAALRLKEFLNAEHDMEVKFEELDDELPNWGYQELEEVPDGVEVI